MVLPAQQRIIKPIPVSVLESLMDCPRKFFLEHRIPKKRSKKAPSAGSTPKKQSKTKRSTESLKTTCLDLHHVQLHLKGRARVLSSTTGVIPVVTSSRGQDNLGTKAALYGLLLENAGYHCECYLEAGKPFDYQPITDAARREAQDLAVAGFNIISKNIEPAGVPGPHCTYCRFRWHCSEFEQKESRNAKPDSTKNHSVPIYSVQELLSDPPAVNDRLPLYVRKQGCKVSIEDRALIISEHGNELSRVLLTDLSHLCLMGNIQVTTQCVGKAMDEGIPVCYFSSKGAFRGMTQCFNASNAHYRRAQYLSLPGKKPLTICKFLVYGKIRNQRNVVIKRAGTAGKQTRRQLKILADKALSAENPDELRGIEGAAASAYFATFGEILDSGRNTDQITFNHRNRRPPKDPVNAMLSFGYMLLLKEFCSALVISGLDAMQGFYHTERSRRPALALDLMEPFRPVFVDSVVLGMINKGQVKLTDFVQENKGVHMTSAMQKRFLTSWENRLSRTWKSENRGMKTDCRGMIMSTVRDLAAFLIGRSDSFELPLFR